VKTIEREEKMYKTRVTLNWRNRNCEWEQSGAFRPKTGLCRHCRSHSLVASLIAPEQWCVFCTRSLQHFLHAINWIQIWRIF